MKEYNKRNKTLARNLRKNMTRQERKLWYDFLNKYPVRIQRQKTILNYIADFYCAKAGLIIELDGSGHYTKMQIVKDEERTKELEKLCIKVLRICNIDIDKNFEGVCEYIDEIIKTTLPQSVLEKLTAPSTEGAKTDK